MINTIKPGSSFNIGNNNYAFTSVPKFPEIPYAEVGRRAKVYRLKSGKDFYALKEFKHAFRKEESVTNCAAIDEYKEVPGLKAAERTVLYPEDYPELIAQYPGFKYAVLMPWMTGESWHNIVSNKTDITADQSLKLAKALAGLMAGLEKHQIAHCDLSSSNFVFSEDFEHVELVDLEEMFGLGLKTPDPLPAGTSGYAPEWIMRKGCWSAGADRFSAGILISEILGWRDERIRQKAYGETFFEGSNTKKEGEIGHKSERHNLLNNVLKQIHPEFSHLFEKVWFSNDLEECPTLEDWSIALDRVPLLGVEPRVIELSKGDRWGIAADTITVTNRGEGILSGEISTNLEAVLINPDSFSLSSNESIVISIDHIRQAGKSSDITRDNKHGTLTVRSNSGELSILIIPPKKTKTKHKWLYFLPLVLVFAYILIKNVFPPSGPTSSPTNIPIPKTTATHLRPTATKVPETPTSTPTPTQINKMISNADGMEMVLVPAGKFLMGEVDDPDAYDDESPEREVFLDAFWIDKTEVTNAMYEKCVNAGVCLSQKKFWHNPDTGSYHFEDPQYGNYPAVYVNWTDGVTYCEWVGRQLPTEAEWEKAARGIDGRKYPWGNQEPDSSYANYDGNVGDTMPVGSFPKGASPYGALDMAGNVYEWTSDYYSNSYNPNDLDNPTGASSGSTHVFRGGSFYASSSYLRTTLRSTPLTAKSERYGSGNWGFRCVLDD